MVRGAAWKPPCPPRPAPAWPGLPSQGPPDTEHIHLPLLLPPQSLSPSSAFSVFPSAFLRSCSPCGGLPYFYSGLIHHCLPFAAALRYGRPTDAESESSPTFSLSLSLYLISSFSSLDVCCCPRFASEGLVNILTRRYSSLLFVVFLLLNAVFVP